MALRMMVVTVCVPLLVGLTTAQPAPAATSAGSADSAARQPLPPDTASNAVKGSPDTAAVSAQIDSSVAPAQVQATGTGGLRIETDPPEATVIVNDSTVRKSPFLLQNLPAGEHRVVVKKVGYFLRRAQVTVKADTTLTYQYQLRRPVQLAIATTPPGATVTVDEKHTGTTPYVNDKLKPGEHLLRISKEGYETVEKKITLQEDTADSLSFPLVSLGAPPRPAPPEAGQSPAARAVILTVFGLFALAILLVEVLGP